MRVYGMDEYGSKEYWEREHRQKKGHRKGEWYGTFDEVYEVLALYLKEDSKSDRILHLGCGMSTLAEGLWRKGWTGITNLDNSQPAIEKAKARDKHLHGVEYQLVDCTDLSEYPDSSFEYIIEKGFLDAVFGSLGSARKVNESLSHIARILKPGGFFISFSAAPRDCRYPHYMRPCFDWSVDCVRVALDPGYYAYACNKRSFHKEWFFPDTGALHVAKDAQQKYIPPVRLKR